MESEWWGNSIDQKRERGSGKPGNVGRETCLFWIIKRHFHSSCTIASTDERANILIAFRLDFATHTLLLCSPARKEFTVCFAFIYGRNDDEREIIKTREIPTRLFFSSLVDVDWIALNFSGKTRKLERAAAMPRNSGRRPEVFGWTIQTVEADSSEEVPQFFDQFNTKTFTSIGRWTIAGDTKQTKRIFAPYPSEWLIRRSR